MHHLHSSSSEHGSQGPLLASPDGFPAEHVSIDVPSLTLNEIEANGLKEIEGDLRLKLILKDWQSKLKESQERKERKQSLSLNVKNEIYQLIGFFILFQGVVLTTVSQATQLTCHTWWGPFALSLLASLTTLVGVCNKFHNFIKWKRACDKEIELSKVPFLKRNLSAPAISSLSL